VNYKMSEQVLSTFKIETEDDFQIEYEILPAYDNNEIDERKKEINKNIADIDAQSSELTAKIEALNKDIDRLTNHADGFDYMIAVGTGVLCGLIDSFFVGEFDEEHFKENKKKITEKFDNIVTEKGKKTSINEKIKEEIKKAKKNAKKKGTKLSKEKEEEIRKRITESIEAKFEQLKQTDGENHTKKALKKYQTTHKLPADGFLSKELLEILTGLKEEIFIEFNSIALTSHPTSFVSISALSNIFSVELG